MKVLIDISHPAHVHFYRHIRQRLVADGAEVIVIARDKDVTLSLLDAFAIPHMTVGASGHRSWVDQARELAARVSFIREEGRRLRPDVVLARNPSGMLAARIIGSVGVFDTDDGRSVGVHYWASAPFARVITAPDSLTESFGAKERKYASYKSLAYLHPNVFAADASIREDLGVSAGQQYSIVRLVAHNASHDRSARGIEASQARRVISELERIGPVFITAEKELSPELGELALRSQPERIHHVLAGAAVVVGDSQTVTTEAAVLGTPAVRINSWHRSSPHLTELEERYGLAYSYSPGEVDQAIERIRRIVEQPREQWLARRERMLADKIDLSDWYYRLVRELAPQ